MTPEADFRAVERAESIARKMDSAFRLPVVGVRLGWDSILGFIPGVGDTLTLLPLALHLRTAHHLAMPRKTMAQMVLNSGLDWLTGLVPLVGDLFDIGFKSNLRNAALLRAHVESRHGPQSKYRADEPAFAKSKTENKKRRHLAPLMVSRT